MWRGKRSNAKQKRTIDVSHSSDYFRPIWHFTSLLRVLVFYTEIRAEQRAKIKQRRAECCFAPFQDRIAFADRSSLKYERVQVINDRKMLQILIKPARGEEKRTSAMFAGEKSCNWCHTCSSPSSSVIFFCFEEHSMSINGKGKKSKRAGGVEQVSSFISNLTRGFRREENESKRKRTRISWFANQRPKEIHHCAFVQIESFEAKRERERETIGAVCPTGAKQCFAYCTGQGVKKKWLNVYLYGWDWGW